MTSSLEDEVRRIVASMESEEQHNQEQETPGTTEQEKEPDETIHIHYFPDAIVILKEDEETPQPHNAVETTLTQTKKHLFLSPTRSVYFISSLFSPVSRFKSMKSLTLQ
jgi:hypothetical protein